MTIFSGRIDQCDDELSHVLHFLHILDQFECSKALLTFEDLTKVGLPCKPHFHFLFISEAKHDKIRRYMSKIFDLKGSKSSLKETDNYDKAAVYTLKQHPKQLYVPYTDLDDEELEHYITLSKDYNDSIKLNNWSEHVDFIIEKFKEKKVMPMRLEIFEYIGEYVYDWNQDESNKSIELPTNLKKTIVNMEQKLLDKKEFMKRFLLDNQTFIYDHDIKQFCNDTKITKIHHGNKSQFFNDSESEN